MRHINSLMFVLLLVSSFSTFANYLKVCTECNGGYINQAQVGSSGIGKKVYVLDVRNKVLVKYKIIGVRNGDFIEGVPFPEEVTLEERGKANAFFESREAFVDDISRNTTLLTDFINDLSSDSVSPVKPNLSIYPAIESCQDSDMNPYEFLSNSSIRSSIFNKMLQFYPTGQAAINKWNSFVSFASVNIGAITVETSFLSVPQTIYFPSGGTLKVVANPSGSTFKVVNGSAFDCNGNNIPQEREQFRGDYNFGTIRGIDGFKKYGQTFGVDFEGKIEFCRSYSTRCFRVGTGRHVCVISNC